jgi:hypothetical protein
MAIIIYFIRGFALLRCCFSSSYRASTRERWKKTPQHRLIMGVGTGIIGLIAFFTIIAVVIATSRK